MSIVEPESRRSERIDRIGAVASTACAAHCAVCALLPAAFGALGLGILLGHEAEWIFSILAIAFAVGALVLGWRRHRSASVALLLVLGIAGLLTSRGLEMGSGHHDHHGEARHAEVHTDDAAATEPEPHGQADADSVESHVSASILGEASHFAGTVVGVLAGLLLFAGHLVGLRASRRCE